MTSFSDLAGSSCPPHEALLLGLAQELGATASAESASAELASLAAALPRLHGAGAQLEALGELVGDRLEVRERGPLLLPDVLARGGGHPAGVATALACAAARAGYDVDLVGNGERLFVAHREATALIDPARGADPVDGRVLRCDLHWRCAHEAAGIVLALIARRSERSGDLARALAASALMFALPVDAGTREGQQAEHQRLLSRLN